MCRKFASFIALTVTTLCANPQIAMSQNQLPHEPGDRYAAISYSPADGAYGYAYEFDTEYGAVNAAQNYCRQSGGRACQTIMRVGNGCGMAARTQNYNQWVAGTGKTRSAARANTLAKCRQRYGTNCQIIAWSCTSP